MKNLKELTKEEISGKLLPLQEGGIYYFNLMNDGIMRPLVLISKQESCYYSNEDLNYPIFLRITSMENSQSFWNIPIVIDDHVSILVSDEIHKINRAIYPDCKERQTIKNVVHPQVLDLIRRIAVRNIILDPDQYKKLITDVIDYSLMVEQMNLPLYEKINETSPKDKETGNFKNGKRVKFDVSDTYKFKRDIPLSPSFTIDLSDLRHGQEVSIPVIKEVPVEVRVSETTGTTPVVTPEKPKKTAKKTATKKKSVAKKKYSKVSEMTEEELKAYAEDYETLSTEDMCTAYGYSSKSKAAIKLRYEKICGLLGKDPKLIVDNKRKHYVKTKVASSKPEVASRTPKESVLFVDTKEEKRLTFSNRASSYTDKQLRQFMEDDASWGVEAMKRCYNLKTSSQLIQLRSKVMSEIRNRGIEDTYEIPVRQNLPKFITQISDEDLKMLINDSVELTDKQLMKSYHFSTEAVRDRILEEAKSEFVARGIGN